MVTTAPRAWENFDEAWLRDRIDAGLDTGQIATRAGVPEEELRHRLRKLGITPPASTSTNGHASTTANGHAPQAVTNGHKPVSVDELFSSEDITGLKRLLALGDQADWQIGDRVLELVPMGARGRTSGAMARVAELAKTCGTEFANLRRLRQVCHAWPPATRVAGVSLNIHGAHIKGGPRKADERASWLRELRDRFGGALTIDRVREELGKQRSRPKADPLRNLLNRIERLDTAAGELPGDVELGDRATAPKVLEAVWKLERVVERLRWIADA
jgi:hypothetical protein